MAAEPENLDELRFRVVDKDTGQVFRIDEIDQHINQAAYTLIPSRDELAQRLSSTPGGRKDDDSDDEGGSPRGACPWSVVEHCWRRAWGWLETGWLD